MEIPASVSSTRAQTSIPFVMSGSSPLSFITEHSAEFPEILQPATGISRVIPFGVGSSTRSGGAPVSRASAAAKEAAAAQLPVV